MKKETYQQPKMKVIELEQMDIIRTSRFPSPQNESYEEEDISVTKGWFN